MTTSRPGPPRVRPADAGQVTIQDVARAAGVGRQTVSNVLNDSGRVGEATKVRVLEAVAALGYHPHHGARSLRSRRTRQRDAPPDRQPDGRRLPALRTATRGPARIAETIGLEPVPVIDIPPDDTIKPGDETWSNDDVPGRSPDT